MPQKAHFSKKCRKTTPVKYIYKVLLKNLATSYHTFRSNTLGWDLAQPFPKVVLKSTGLAQPFPKVVLRHFFKSALHPKLTKIRQHRLREILIYSRAIVFRHAFTIKGRFRAAFAGRAGRHGGGINTIHLGRARTRAAIRIRASGCIRACFCA